MKIDEIEKLVRLFESSSLAKMEVEENDLTIKLEKNTDQGVYTVQTSAPIETAEVHPTDAVKEEPALPEGHWLTSPLVGTYYQSNVENGDALVSVGDSVKKGDLVCIIEAMKMMNEIRSDCDGVVTAINVENGEMVEYDQPLICIGGAK